MPYTISNIIQDVLPRVAQKQAGAPNGITVWMAANSIQSLIFKELLDRKSDLLVTGDLFLVIPAYDYCAPLPSGFLSMAEKPKALSAPDWTNQTAWMAGTVISYNSATKTLMLNVATSNGSGTYVSWSIAVGTKPGQPIYTLDTSASSVAVGTGSKTFVTATALDLVAGQNIIVSAEEIPTDSTARSRVDPEYLDDDNHEDYQWWEEYKLYGETWETASVRPRRFKIIGTDFYIRPKVTAAVMISGKYNAKPTDFTEGTYSTEIPWNGFFDEIFRQGVVRILLKGIEIPDADKDFMIFFNREFGKLINSRVRMIPDTRRTKRGNFM